jgi:sigma-E factor negative regulatory protein RseA
MSINKDTLEQLSEFVDGQVKRETGMFFAKRLSADPELQATWSRYHLIRECVRHRGAPGQASQLQRRVALAIAAEPEPGRAAAASNNRWLRPVAGLAITAVVAVTAVIGVQNRGAQPGAGTLQSPAGTEVVQFTTPQNNGLGPVSNAAVPVSYQAGSVASSQRLNAYLLRHNQVTANSGRGGVIYLAPMVSARTAESKDARDAEPEMSTQETETSTQVPQEEPNVRPTQ